jgi:hypothetical protein
MQFDDNRPAVFLSSTISDFADLRSALGFYLEKSGFRVFMSETTTFPVNPSHSNFEQCFELIDRCRYYILLVGTKRGTWYKINESTVTQEEFRRARRKSEQTGNIHIFTFVRDEVWKFVEEYRNSGGSFKPSAVEDIEFTSRFLDEITRASDFSKAQNIGDSFPKGTWVSRFNRFSDIVDVLARSMRIDTNRRMEILRGLALDELVTIIRACFDDFTTSRRAYAIFEPLMPIIESKSSKDFKMTAREVRYLPSVAIMALSFNNLKTEALSNIISSGEWLEYDSNEKRYKKSSVMILTEVLIGEINRVKNYFSSIEFSTWYSKLRGLGDYAKHLPDNSMMEIPEDVFVTLWMLGRTYRILQNAWVIYQVLWYPERDFTHMLESLSAEYYNLVTISGEFIEPVPLHKVQEWFERQGIRFE